jgi:hypothetical protein
MRIPHKLGLGLLLLALPACASMPRPGNNNNGVGGAPATFVRLATESQFSRTIDLRNGITKPAGWRSLTEYLSEKHTIAVRDQAAGFAMTAWEASLTRDGVPDLRYRTRLVVNFLGDNWEQLQVRAEASWKEGETWQVGYDRQLLDSATAELQARFGPRGNGR